MQDKLDIKLKSRSNLLRWNAQFSPQLIEFLLDEYAERGQVVLDPFVGSGTVLVEAARKDISAIGVELNPSAKMLSDTYMFCMISPEERKSILNKFDNIVQPQKVRDLIKYIQHHKKDALLVILIKLYIVLLDVERHKEPLQREKNRVMNKIHELIIELPFTAARIENHLGNARELSNFIKKKADLVITSPPYINVFNYHQQYRNSTELLGYEVLNIAKSEIGSNRQNRQNRFLTVITYILSMKDVLVELSNTTVNKGRMIIIVGRESNILQTPFYNGEILKGIAHDVLGLKILTTNERKYTNRFGKIIFEDILHIENTYKKNSSLGLKTYITEVLKNAKNRSTMKNRALIDNAIRCIDKVISKEKNND